MGEALASLARAKVSHSESRPVPCVRTPRWPLWLSARRQVGSATDGLTTTLATSMTSFARRRTPVGEAVDAVPAAGPHPLRVLLVDDDLLLARLLKANLGRPGQVDVECVESAEEAVARLARG